MRFSGIDVSKHNGIINWSKVKADGIDFVIIRAGYGSSTIDEKFKANIEGAIKVGIDVGIYWFSYATSESKAKAEAIKCMEVISPYKSKIIYPVFYELEYDSVRYAKKQGVTIDKTRASSFAKAFLDEIKSGGYIPGLYTNIDFSNNYFFKSTQRQYDVWIAQYRSRTTYSEPYVMWQYSDKGKVSGISGYCDMNYSYKDYNSQKNTNNEESSKDNTDSGSKESNDVTNGKEFLIRNLQKALNESYGTSLSVDGIYGPKTKAVVKSHQLSVSLRNKKLQHVTWLQQALKDLGYTLSVDGYYGSETQEAVKRYQKSKGLDIDGIAGPATHNSLVS